MARPNGVFKTENDYQKLISPEVYDKTPKAVFAALCVSLFTNWANKAFEDIDAAIKEEWETLNANGIVPQKSIK